MDVLSTTCLRNTVALETEKATMQVTGTKTEGLKILARIIARKVINDEQAEGGQRRGPVTPDEVVLRHSTMAKEESATT